MSGILNTILRSNVVKTASMSLLRQGMSVGMANSARSISHMAKTLEKSTSMNTWHKSKFGCSCGGGCRFNHTEGSAEMLDFLNEEIESEKRATKNMNIPTTLNGFAIKFDNADIELVKQDGNEKIEVSLNVNHTIDSDIHPSEEENEAELKSKPSFEVNIIKNGTTLSFTCEFMLTEPVEGEYDDVFGIQEVIVFRGEWNDKTYSCAGDILDGYLYDLLMNTLAKKGITNEFVAKLSELSTSYERSLYVKFLESLKTFA